VLSVIFRAQAAWAAGLTVCPVPGPSAVTTLLSASGFPAERYVFEGFLPSRPGERRRRLRELREELRAIVLFESPHRLVATHLLATGLVAVGDDLVHSVVGGSALARISRRFGEGVMNGALTARVGVAALDVCRPLPFAALPRPKVSNLIGRALTGLFQRE
jgi:hypothetical protein